MNQKDQEKDRAFLKEIQKMSQAIEQQKDLMDKEPIYRFIDKAKRLPDSILEIKKDGRVLRMGIVGSVKAGKSSFLNALIFDGEPILPKAPTPMTAALTKLSYAEQPKATIVFYKKGEWKEIEKKAEEFQSQVNEKFQQERARYQQTQQAGQPLGRMPNKEDIEAREKRKSSDSLVSSFELVAMVRERNLNLNELLGEEPEVTGTPQESPEDYIKKRLSDYVGADGQYTPLVNHIKLAINNPLLEGFEVIDTPGLNDPVISRGRVTKEYLTHCDVVLIVCQVGQFLTQQDIVLISKQLTQESVAQAYIIGSQLDSGVLQYDRREHSLEEAFHRSLDIYERQAQDVLEKLSKDGNPLVARLKKTLPPEFVSALMYGIARKLERGQALNEEEQHVVDTMKKRFADFSKVLETPDDYMTFSGIKSVEDRVQSVREKKEEIIQERIDTYSQKQATELLKLIGDIYNAACTNRENLRTGDLETLERKLRSLNQKLDSIRVEVSNLFNRQAVVCQRHIQEIKIEIRYAAEEFRGFKVEKEVSFESYTENYGFLGLWERQREERIETNIAYVVDVVVQMTNYGTAVQKLINSHLKDIFDIDGIKRSVKECVIGAFDLSDTEFSANEILIPLETLLNKLSVKKVIFDFIPEIEDAFYDEFPSGKAEGDGIHYLHRVQEQQFGRILQKFSQELDELGDDAVKDLEIQSVVFVDRIQEKMKANIELTKSQLENQTENLKRYDDFISELERYKTVLAHFEE